MQSSAKYNRTMNHKTHKHAPSFVTTVPPWGGGVLPNVGYIGMCFCEGYGFKQFSPPIKENYVLLLKNKN